MNGVVNDSTVLQCRQISVKTCRCGARKKELPCYKEYMCDTKCSKMKDCRRHQCKRKVCKTSDIFVKIVSALLCQV